MSEIEEKKDIAAFLNDLGKVTQIPASNKKKILVLAYLVTKFQQEGFYSEKEVNEILNSWHTFGDYFILRRLLIDYKFLDRTPNGAKYWVV